jgi:signal peptidase II
MVSLFFLAADIITKYLTQAYLPRRHAWDLWYPYGGIPVFKNFFGIEFSIVHATNKGMAWGLAGEHQELLLYIRIGLILGILGYLAFFNKASSHVWPLCLVITGAIGNVIDYYIYGHVVDMFHFVLWGYDYPVFNVADSLICIGIFWLIVQSLWSK